MQLYGSFTSPYVRHCRIALIEGGIEFEFVETDYAASARLTPTRRVPFLKDGNLLLTDSASILRHIRETSRRPFLQTVEQADLFAMVNTAMDSTVNLFLLERDGITPAQSPYLQRQADRVQDILNDLNERLLAMNDQPSQNRLNDALLRLGCFLDWARFRQRIDPARYSALQRFLDQLAPWPPFVATRPRL
ncbi:glutathione S-transferase [Wenzhouxiangella sp. AB-CW3]|uniref:glutathione S-transferase family protein n=1 Tax=Wenzhouxiangella sp. AB-CW3 TaxID=2771012 RepID=UPI00168AB1AA|nr:glutathione S-transferase [Wenzhouxiangella sp. AB-CW3]QOC23160.1 glutathione S-transferase [Wenzhouxiangella sp. AB-CW3]